MGVWIEISFICSAYFSASVTPLVGVWIEIQARSYQNSWDVVTPLVGVWIEIQVYCAPLILLLCHSPRGSVD